MPKQGKPKRSTLDGWITLDPKNLCVTPGLEICCTPCGVTVCFTCHIVIYY